VSVLALKKGRIYRDSECVLVRDIGRGIYSSSLSSFCIQHVLALIFGVNSHVARSLFCAKSYHNEGKVNDKCETMRDGETSVTFCKSEALSLSF